MFLPEYVEYVGKFNWWQAQPFHIDQLVNVKLDFINVTSKKITYYGCT